MDPYNASIVRTSLLLFPTFSSYYFEGCFKNQIEPVNHSCRDSVTLNRSNQRSSAQVAKL